jgi:hypothetical protein
VLYAADGAWWRAKKGVPEFNGLKLTQDSETCVRFLDIHKVDLRSGCCDLLVDAPGTVGTGGAEGGNSGFHALNLAVQFGATRIVLVGFDMRTDRGLHWHGRHGNGLNNPTVRNFMSWRRVLDGAATQLAGLGIEMLNASQVSTLTAYPLVNLEDAL